MSETIEGLRKKIDEWHEIKEQIRALEDQISDLNKVLGPKVAEISQVMEALDIKRFDGSNCRVNLLTIDYVNNPQTETEKESFYSYLKKEGIFDEMVSVHHQKLNSWYKNRVQELIEQGQEVAIPGLEPKQRTELRKGR